MFNTKLVDLRPARETAATCVPTGRSSSNISTGNVVEQRFLRDNVERSSLRLGIRIPLPRRHVSSHAPNLSRKNISSKYIRRNSTSSWCEHKISLLKSRTRSCRWKCADGRGGGDWMAPDAARATPPQRHQTGHHRTGSQVRVPGHIRKGDRSRSRRGRRIPRGWEEEIRRT